MRLIIALIGFLSVTQCSTCMELKNREPKKTYQVKVFFKCKDGFIDCELESSFVGVLRKKIQLLESKSYDFVFDMKNFSTNDLADICSTIRFKDDKFLLDTLLSKRSAKRRETIQKGLEYFDLAMEGIDKDNPTIVALSKHPEPKIEFTSNYNCNYNNTKR